MGSRQHGSVQSASCQSSHRHHPVLGVRDRAALVRSPALTTPQVLAGQTQGFPSFHAQALAVNPHAGGSMGMSVGPLGGYSILVVDDEPLIAIGLNEALRDAGAEVLTAHDLTTALEAAVNSSVSAAILDVQLGAADCGAVCAALTSQEVPFMFLTGFDSHDVLKEWASIPTLAKPTGEAELLASLEALLKPADDVGVAS